MKSKRKQITEFFVSKQRIIFIMLISIITITILSKSSPLYPFNDGVNTNIYMTMGRAILYGKVPYKDLYDHKGPLLYFIYSIAALISETSFIGIWLWEIAACYFFLFFSYKIMEGCNQSLGLIFIPILSAIVYGSGIFYNGGEPEEFCLPIISYAIYIGLQMLNSDWKFKKSSCLIIGITSGILFWMKFNLCFVYLGWFLVISVVFIRNHRIKDLIKMCLCIFAGVAFVTVPVIIYFSVNNGINDLFKVYFYDNIYTYGRMSNVIIYQKMDNILTGIDSVRYDNIYLYVCMIIGLIFLFIHSRKKFIFVITLILTMGIGIYCGIKSYEYYGIPFSVFVPFVMEAVRNLKFKGKEQVFLRKIKSCVVVMVCVEGIILAYVRSPNVYLLKYEKSDMPQFLFAEKISQVEDATLLEYNCMDLGVYTVSGIVPNCRYYFKPNLVISDFYESQKKIVENGSVDFIVTMGELKTDLYECVASADFLYWDGGIYIKHYYLYQLIVE